MQRRQRKMSTRQRNPRAARNPAYQIKPRYHLAPDSVAEGTTETWDAGTVQVDDDTQWQRPVPSESIHDDPEETTFQPEVQREPEEQETEAPPEDEPEPSPAPTPPARDEPDDFAAYVRKIEEAAARSRAEQRGVVMTAPRPVVSASHHPAAASAPTYGQARPQRRRAATPQRTARGGRRGGGPPPPPVRKPFFRRRRTWLMILALLILIPLVLVLLYTLNILRLGISAYGDIHTPPEDRVRYVVNVDGTPEPVSPEEADAMMPNWDENDIVNIVLMGVDDRDDEAESIRSDTIIVVNINPQTGDVAMMSIPRDLLVYIPEFGDEKMNAAYAIGDANDDTIPGGGPTLVAQTIEANFNIPIHYYATIDFEGFRRIVDTVGGVVIDVPHQLSDNLYPTDDLRLTRIYFGTGLQIMDGTQALEYVRTRHADSDIARGQRQQQVLMAIRERAVVRDLITRAPDLIEDVSDTLRTDLSFNEMLALANLGRNIDPEKIVRVDLWQEGILTEHFPEFEGDAYYLEANWVRVHQLQEEFFFAPERVLTPTTEPVADAEEEAEPTATPTEVATEPDLDTPVMVENGTSIPALAGQTTQFLVESGFTAVWPSDAEEMTETTVIYDNSPNSLTAIHLAETLGLSQDTIVREAGNGNITIIIGDDFPLIDDPPIEP